jgi:hypothetical protein
MIEPARGTVAGPQPARGRPVSAERPGIAAPRRGVPPARPERPPGLSLELTLDLVVCGVSLAGLSLLARYLRPDFPLPTLGAGLGGGALCVLWGVWGLRGVWCRRSALVTLAVLAVLFAAQAAASWQREARLSSVGRMEAALLFVALTLNLGMLWTLLRANRPPPP